ncbi:hypothetical protein JL720_15395 [Aureococcus anophagefferens]|nr:hypothetical protein JL720_15395 [Aureococcus anophagefferens]
MEAPAPSPRFADAQAVDDERFVGDSSWWACLSEWFRSEQGDGPESFAQLRKEVRLLKRENAALRELARSRGATPEDVARACSILEPLTPAQAVATLYGDAEGGWAAAATSSGSVVSAGDSASGDAFVYGAPSCACLVVVGRHAAAAAKTPKRVFDQLAELGSPIGWRLRSATRDAVLAEWAACRDDDVQRVAFLKRARLRRRASDGGRRLAVRDGFETRDAAALCCCVPELRSRFFEPTTVSCQGCDHLVVGCEPAASSVKPDPALRAVLEQSYQHGISLNSSLCRPEIIVVSDPGQDLDDEMAFVLLRALIEEGLVSCAGVVCNLRPAGRRALLARGTLDCLGLQHVPVAAGSDGGSKKHEDTFSDSAAHYMPERCELPDGQALLKELYENAPSAASTCC